MEILTHYDSLYGRLENLWTPNANTPQIEAYLVDIF